MDITIQASFLADQPGTSIVLEPPGAPGGGITGEERRFRDPAGNLIRIQELR